MFTTSLTSIRRSAGSMLTLLIAAVMFNAEVTAQTPAVVASSAVAVPNAQANGAPWQTAVSNRGDFLLFDFKTSGFYQFPANGGAQITLGAPGAIAGGFTDSGIAVDPRNNNIYLNNNYNGGLLEFPYDAAKNTWDLPSVVVANGLAGNLGGSCGNYFQAAGMAMNSNGILAVATENGCGIEIFTVPVDTSGNFGAATPIVSNMKARAKTVAIDNAGNIYYNADAGGFTGVAYIPAGVTGLANEATVTRIDPMLGNVQGVTLDNSGNIYIADGTAGEYLVPLAAGVPDTAGAVFLAPEPANGGPSFDTTRQALFLPISTYSGISNDVKILFNRLELGTSAIGVTAPTAGTVTYSFSAATTPYNFVIAESSTSGVFTLGALTGCGVTLTPPGPNGPVLDKNGAQARTTTAYAAGSTCTIPISFTPQAVGDVSATLTMLDANQNVLNTVVLHGVGQGSESVMAPGTESAIGSGLMTPSQVATDVSGDIYVADSGLGKALEYKKGSTSTSTPVSIGTGLTAPTGVAVDAAGDVYIADSGSVFKVPFGVTGYDSTGQALTGLNAAGQVTVKTGLGTNLKLAVDDVGDLFIGDPDNQRVVRLVPLAVDATEIDYTGFASLTAIGASGEGDLFLANGANLIEIPAYGAQTTILSSLSGATGIAADPSGSVYLTEAGQTLRIPDESGTYTPADEVTLAPSVTNPTSVALDSLGNAYVTDGTAKDIDFINTNGYLNLGTLATPTSTQTGVVTIADSGNLPLNITAFSSTLDFSETATTCIGAPIAVGSLCTATVTFNPGPGDQGPLTGQLIVSTDAANSPVVINGAGIGAALAVSTSSLTATNLTVTNAPVVINVVSASGAAPVPTGKVTLTAIANGKVTNTFAGTLVNGTVTINATEIEAGTYTLKVSYGGDRVYGTSTASITVTIGVGAVTLTQPPASSVPTYILSQGSGSSSIYDGSEVPYEYNYLVTLTSADGNPLIGVPVYGTGGQQISTNYGTVTFTGSDAGGNCAPIQVNANGTAVFNTSCLGVNTSNNQIPDLLSTYTITPVFTSANYVSVTGTSFTVTAVRNPVVQITSNPTSISVAAGATATANLTLTSLLGFGVLDPNENLDNYTLPVGLDCNNLPPHATCSFSYPTPDPSDPNSVDVTPTMNGQVVMTITTNVPTGITTSQNFRESPAVFAAMFGVSLLGLAFGRRNGLRVSLFNAVCVLFLTGMLAGVVACGSGTTGNAPILTTPSGTYAVTVTAKQVGSKTVPGSLPGTTQTVYGSGNLMSLPFTVNVTVQ